MNEFLDKYGTDTTTNFQLMRWANELNISPFYYCMRDEINDLKYKKAWINKAKPYFVDQIGDTLQGDLDMNNFSITNLKSPENDNNAIHKKYLMEQLNLIEIDKDYLKERINDVKRFFKRQMNNNDFIDDTKLQQEVKVDSLFFTQGFFIQGLRRHNKKFNAKKVLQFINGTKNVETKEYESNDENNKVNHLYEIKTSGKYLDRFRMLIIQDKEEDEFILSDFDMLLETETPPSMNTIRNPKPQKKDISFYEFLRATDFEYVKLYFVDNGKFTSIDIHKSQQKQNFLIRDDAYVNIIIYIEKPKFSVHLNKINDSK
ncbi:hypothetical protein LOTGIDRAFT_163655 [Lottia gigantea]|uniref:Uncharacterized protein n=1 Tax=Lottia gigantea TaxID=225164 RepID=V3ZHM7_LOTGI|nr:hypothetical protein LOTGIDRAFT_163655 [Lottia gigantea]ESO90773.1 hypothetical protein LOTGIDRAFT_163655 [Lottia gigantea]